MARTTDRREFVQLAEHYDPDKHFISGWFYSEKLDGMRAFWDGGITRDMYCSEIPFANTAKDHIRLSPPKATGLWSRYGNVINAPTWFLDELPSYPLDGELHCGRGNFQQTMSTARKLTPIDDEWMKVSYRVFDLPDYTQVFKDGRISCPQWEYRFTGVMDWLHNQTRYKQAEPKLRRFETVAFLLEREHPHDGNHIVRAVSQVQLPFNSAKAQATIDRANKDINELGGEGLILKAPGAIWEPQRVQTCLKVKSYFDEEVTVTGYTSGRKTDRGSKLLGLMGAAITDFRGKRLELSGFTDEERRLTTDSGSDAEAFEWASENPGAVLPEHMFAKKFPRGTKITILFRELTVDGLPKEARYSRIRPEE